MGLAVVPAEPDANPDLLAEYLRHLIRRNCSQTTINNYRVCLTVWLRWLAENEIDDPAENDVDAFLDSRHGRDTEPFSPPIPVPLPENHKGFLPVGNEIRARID